MNLAQLKAEKWRLALLLSKAIESHNDLAIRVNAKKISSLNLRILRLNNKRTNQPKPNIDKLQHPQN